MVRKFIKIFSTFIATILFSILTVASQVQIKPFSLNDMIQAKIKNITEINYILTPKPNIDSLLLMEKELNSDGIVRPELYGLAFDYSFDLINEGTWDSLDNGDRICRFRIKSPDAYSINLHFSKLNIAKSSYIFFYNLSSKFFVGPFTHTVNKSHGKYTTSSLKGDEIIVELYESKYDIGKNTLLIDKVVYGYKNVFKDYEQIYKSKQMEELQSGSCNRDVNCPEGDDWCKQKYSVAIINAPMYNNNWGWCSGSLLNNTNNDYIPYFLTAFHCLDHDISNSILSQTEMDNVSDWSFRFGYFREGCNSGVVMPFFDYSGADFISAWNTTDFALLRLEEQPQSGEYNFSDVYFNGWDRTGDIPINETAIHHPAGDYMKITRRNSSPYTVNFSFWATDWDTGTTEGGSSGSPLFDENKRVIGQNKGRLFINGVLPPPCDSTTTAIFGKLSLSWEGGGTSETRLRDWLDPNDNGLETLDGIKMPLLKYGWQVLNGQNFTRYAYDVYKLGSNQYAPFVVNNGANLTLKAGREIVIRPCSKILNGSTFIASINNISCSDLVYLSDKESIYGGNICNSYPPKASVDNQEFDNPIQSTFQITPNPFNDEAKVTINLTNNEEVSLSLFDLLGNNIITLEDQSLLSQGIHDYTITSTNLNSGMYYIVFTTKNESITQKLILVK